ncbi:MAG TPA: hypothetical protein PL185_00730 [Flavobacteriales bacterium]|nr:hypothetical protein [Flavobacteriales bacterium]HPH81065.1 hypothetical protein [Flavobacteriales bacterium]
MRVILIYILIAIQLGYSQRNIVNDEVSDIRTICIEKFVEDYNILDKESLNVVDFQLDDSVDISPWKNHMFDIKWLDTIIAFDRSDYLDMINENDIITFRDNEFQIPNKPSYLKYNVIQFHRENFYTSDTIGFLRIMPIIFDTRNETSILFLRFYRGIEESVTYAYFLKLINLKWSIQGCKILAIS